MSIFLLCTPLTRRLDFATLDRRGVDIYRPIFCFTRNRIIGYPITAPAAKVEQPLRARSWNK
tara:strand:- start:641 stop:826 length:186 start_codon:yes stop_codon:yes gene_type:complete